MTKAIMVAGLGFGDEGKGTTVEALVKHHGSTLVCRYNGGAQAAHNVVTPDGRWHTFSQWGAGTLLGARTYLSHRMIVDPLALVREAEHLRDIGVSDPFGMLYVSGDAPVVTPIHRQRNMLDEQRLGHGSCGMGIGAARLDAMVWPESAILVRDLVTLTDRQLAERIDALDLRLGTDGRWHSAGLAIRLLDAGQSLRHVVDHDWLRREMQQTTAIFEGAQGVLLDQTWGFQPHTTWSDCTFHWADELAEECGVTESERVGVLRAYHTRHGAGPFPTERPLGLDEPHSDGGFAGRFRTGDLDMSLVRYALGVVGGVDALAITSLDRRDTWRVCTSWGQSSKRIDHVGIKARATTTFDEQTLLTREVFALDPSEFRYVSASTAELVSMLEDVADVPARVLSFGPTVDDKVVRGESL